MPYPTLVIFPLGRVKRTVKVAMLTPASPSTTVTSFTAIPGTPSLSVMMPVASALFSSRFVGAERFTKKVSFDSLKKSGIKATKTVWLVIPGGKVTTPLVGR